MPFSEFTTPLARYNATLPTLTDTNLAENLQVDVNGRLIVATQGNSLAATVSATDLDIRDLAHTQDSVRIGDGTDLANVTAAGELNVLETNSADMLTALQLIDNLVLLESAAAAGGEAGVQMLAVRQDTLGALANTDGDFSPLKVNENGELYITGSLNTSVDDVFESGTESDAASDSVGDGVVTINNTTDTDLVTIAVGAGQTLYIVGMDFHADKQASFELIVDNNGTPAEWIRVGSVEGLRDAHKTFPRAIEIIGAADRSVILRARKNGATGGTTANASGAINAYIR